MKFFELIKWGSEGRKEEAGEVIFRGTLEEIADFVSENGLAWNEIPNSPLGGCCISKTEPDTAETYDVVPVSSVASKEEVAYRPAHVGEHEFVIRARMADIIAFAGKNDLQFRKIIKDEPASRYFAWWALSERDPDADQAES